MSARRHRRVLISPELRQAAGLTREPCCWAWGGIFDLWDKATYEGQGGQAMQAGLPGSFEDFTF